MKKYCLAFESLQRYWRLDHCVRTPCESVCYIKKQIFI